MIVTRRHELRQCALPGFGFFLCILRPSESFDTGLFPGHYLSDICVLRAPGERYIFLPFPVGLR